MNPAWTAAILILAFWFAVAVALVVIESIGKPRARKRTRTLLEPLEPH